MNRMKSGLLSLIVSALLYGASCEALDLSLWGVVLFLAVGVPVQWLLSTGRIWGFWGVCVTGFLAGALSPFLTVLILAPCVLLGLTTGVLATLGWLKAAMEPDECASEALPVQFPQPDLREQGQLRAGESVSPFPWDPKSPHYQVINDPKLNLISGNIYNTDD